jgi:hypothetical protein
MKMFSGFRSLWMIRASCKSARPRRISPASLANFFKNRTKMKRKAKSPKNQEIRSKHEKKANSFRHVAIFLPLHQVISECASFAEFHHNEQFIIVFKRVNNFHHKWRFHSHSVFHFLLKTSSVLFNYRNLFPSKEDFRFSVFDFIDSSKSSLSDFYDFFVSRKRVTTKKNAGEQTAVFGSTV